jgi:hypothetical protein
MKETDGELANPWNELSNRLQRLRRNAKIAISSCRSDAGRFLNVVTAVVRGCKVSCVDAVLYKPTRFRFISRRVLHTLESQDVQRVRRHVP